MGIIGSIIIGCLAGFCAGKLMKGGGMGFVMNLVLGTWWLAVWTAGHTVGQHVSASLHMSEKWRWLERIIAVRKQRCELKLKEILELLRLMLS